MAMGNRYTLVQQPNLRFRATSSGDLFLRYGELGVNGKPVYNTSVLRKVVHQDAEAIVFETASGSWYKISRKQLPIEFGKRLQIMLRFPELAE